MKTIEIVGKNYHGQWNKTRLACRGIIIDGTKILLSYEENNGQWMIPGGGIENTESDTECCIREVAEETGMLVEVSDCMLEIVEYYDDWKWVNHYFICNVIGTTERKPTKRELDIGMVPKWISIDEGKEIFSQYEIYADTDKMRRDIYLREHTALHELIKETIEK